LLALNRKRTNDLALRLRNNDIDAFNSLYWHYHSPIYANAFKLVKDQAIAEDIVQEVFITLWEKRHLIDPGQDIAGWLFVVCYHRSVDLLKRKIRQAIAEKVLQPVMEDPGVFDVDIAEEQIGAIEKAVGQLSPQKRKVFELCKVQHRTYEKAAEELHLSKYTVKEYLADAITSIKKYIGHPTQAGMIIQFFMLSGFLSP
jgi:RNA polymerase sigma factor (sigma-70 family)